MPHFQRLATLLCLTLLPVVVAQAPLLGDDTVLDELREKFAGGFPTVAAVDALRAEGVGRFEAGDCITAIPALEEWAAQTNFLANLYRTTIEPFYGTYSGDRQAASYNLNQLVALEAASNDRIHDRNLAWVMIAECHMILGDPSTALVYFSQALDRLRAVVVDRDVWSRARSGVLEAIGHDR